MSLRCPELRLLLAALAITCAAAQAAPELRVCADPANLPYSQRDESGFENRIAHLVAEDLGMRLSWFWQEQTRGFVRKTMGAGECDVFIGVPAGFDKVLRTRPYYRSTYVAVTRHGEPPFAGFAQDRLNGRRFGVQLIGNDLAASPPGHALARAGAVDNVTGYPVYGDGPAAQRMVDAVAGGRIDVALVWGPQAGWFARRAAVPLDVAPLQAPPGLAMPFEFAIAMGVRKGDTALRDRLDAVLARRKADIDAILDAYAVPRIAGGLPRSRANSCRPCACRCCCYCSAANAKSARPGRRRRRQASPTPPMPPAAGHRSATATKKTPTRSRRARPGTAPTTATAAMRRAAATSVRR
jgi:quinoprotein dehydrogenase-associated probable ABC transporter substrate-binding protein